MTTATVQTDGATPRWYRSIPRKGWSCSDVEDHEDAVFTCELCGFNAVRYVHVMDHSDYPGELRVGCVCAGHLEQNYAAAKGRERVARNLAARRVRWCKRDKWRTSAKGNLWRKFCGVRVVVFPSVGKPGEWKAAIGNRIGTLSHPTPSDAMKSAFHRLSHKQRIPT